MRQLIFIMLVFTGAIRLVKADEPETAAALRAEIKAQIEAGTSAFDAAIATTRDSVTRSLEDKANLATSRGDIHAADAANLERHNFLSHNRKPTLVTTRVFEKARDRGLLRLIRVYEKGIQRYTKAGLAEDARILEDLTEELRIRKRQPPLKGTLGEQLLVNPGCEETTTNQGLVGWTPVVGRWIRLIDNPDPKTGQACFSSQTRSCELVQTVEVDEFASYIDASSIEFSLTGEVMRTQKIDVGCFVIDLIDNRGRLIESFNCGNSRPNSAWQSMSIEGPVPVRTRFMRVQLRSLVSKGKKGGMANVYFDDLSLKLSLKK